MGKQVSARTAFELITSEKGVPIKAWIRGVPLEKEAEKQLHNAAQLPFIYPWIAVMPDVHWGIGATVGSVIPALGAVIPSAVGVDIGCGMAAVQTNLKKEKLPVDLLPLRQAIEEAIPHGRTDQGGKHDSGAWQNGIPPGVLERWNEELCQGYQRITKKYPELCRGNDVNHLGTLGTGNHFIEMGTDENDCIWFMLHSGSRGVGNRMGTFFIRLARERMGKEVRKLPDPNLAWFEEGTRAFRDYMEAVEWAQQFALINRELMMRLILEAVARVPGIPSFQEEGLKVNCHHNYVSREFHYGKLVYLTRKGAIRAGSDDLGIIPGSMGAKSYIVRGLGNRESFNSCSHGAGRICSRNEAIKRFTLEEHKAATIGVECRKDKGVLDETPMAYKSIEAVMEAQKDLAAIVHTLKQLVCVKG
jgi:tRNA-splicing ligase RtcB (3'-phosphate/5'-hydroxy nucleic acid ligase)